MRVVFLGTPDFAVPGLKALIDHTKFEVVGVVTQPDRPAGRGQKLKKSAVKLAAEEAGLPIFQPSTLKDESAVAKLQSWNPDVIVVAAFGQILRKPVLELPPHGCINIHASLLPRWRGAAPIQYALRAGDKETGVTIMQMDVGLDTGPMLAWKSIPILADDTAQTLHDKLAELGAKLLPDTLLKLINGEITSIPQPDDGVTLAPSIRKEEGHIDWKNTAEEIDYLIRAFTPWPGTFTFLGEERIKIIQGKPLSDLQHNAEPGTLFISDSNLHVGTGKGIYLVESLQPAGKKPMPASAFLAGHSDIEGKVLI